MTEDVVPARRGRRWLWVVVAAAVVLLAGGAAYAWTAMSPSSGFTVKGDFTITSGTGLKWGSNTSQCAGDGGYADISQASTVVVTDAAGKTVAIGRMDGEGVATRGTGLASGVRPASCRWTFTVEGVPEGDFFGVEISHRGRQQYSREQLREPIHLSLG